MVDRFFESLILVDEGSVQLVSTSFALRLPQKVEHLLCCDSRACKHTVTHRCFSGPTRESLQRWFLSVQTSFPSRLRFVESVFRESGHRHLAPRQRGDAASVAVTEIVNGVRLFLVDELVYCRVVRARCSGFS